MGELLTGLIWLRGGREGERERETRDEWWAVVNTVRNLRVALIVGFFLLVVEVLAFFLKNVLLHGVSCPDRFSTAMLFVSTVVCN